MSAAHQLNLQEPIQNTSAPAVRPATRPAPKKGKVGGILAVGSIWLAVMFLCFSLVQKTAAIRSETGEIASMREEIARLEQQKLALEGSIANQGSVAEVSKWAAARGMKQPTEVIQTLSGKPEAVAVRQSPAPQPAQVAQAGNGSFWQSLFARFTGSTATSQAAGAKQ